MKEQQPFNLDGRKNERYFMGLCIGIGLAIGAGIGVVIDNIGAGMGVGFILGVAIDFEMYSNMEAEAKKEGKIRSL